MNKITAAIVAALIIVTLGAGSATAVRKGPVPTRPTEHAATVAPSRTLTTGPLTIVASPGLCTSVKGVTRWTQTLTNTGASALTVNLTQTLTDNNTLVSQAPTYTVVPLASGESHTLTGSYTGNYSFQTVYRGEGFASLAYSIGKCV